MKKKVLILGSQGRLGAALVRDWSKDTLSLGIESVVALGRKDLDFSDPVAAVKVLASYQLQEGDLVVNCAALTNVDGCEREKELAAMINATTPILLAELAAQQGVRFLHLSTDYVFDGSLDRSYRESDPAQPLSHYGATKLAAEEGILAASINHVVARISWVFGPDRPSFIDQIIQRALVSPEAAAVHDKVSSPSYTKDLASWLSVFCNASVAGGIYHLCNSGVCSWRDYGEFALQCAARYGMPVLTTTVAPLQLAEMKGFIAKRPRNTALDTSKFAALYGKPLRSWQEALEEYISCIPLKTSS